MSEDKETKEGADKPEEDSGKGDKPETDDPIERANKAAERLEKANEEQGKVLNEQKEFEAKRILGGQTRAGQEPVKKEEIDPVQYLKDVETGKFNKKKE